jgi:excinuclease ABC subunit B
MDRAIKETNRRRAIQVEYNKKNNITPKTIIKKIHDITDQLQTEHSRAVAELIKIDRGLINDPVKFRKLKEEQMQEAVKALDFETAALIRDEIIAFEEKLKPTKKRV